MTIITLLVEHASWEGAATDLTSKLWNEGVKKGSILWIDAHCYTSVTYNSKCCLTAYWDDRFETTEEQTHIKYKLINNSFSWDTFYNQADQIVSMLEPKDVISITASCSRSKTASNAVLFVFHYDNVLVIREKQNIKHCNVSVYAWDDAAEKIISELENKGAKAGQIIAIDAHNNKPGGYAIFSAWWNESLPVFGDLHGYMMKEGINNKDSWEEQAIKARDSITDKSDGKAIKVFSFTSSINDQWGYGVTYTFYAEDEVVKDGFILDEGNIITEEPVRRFKKTPTTQNNPADVNVEHWETLSESLENTSTFTSTYEQTSGWKLTAGAEIPVPDTPATISASVEKTHTERREQTNKIVTRQGNSFETKVEFIIPPKSILVVRFIEEIREFSAPYTMTMVSGRVSSGIWKTQTTNVYTLGTSFPLDTPADVIERELKNTDIY